MASYNITIFAISQPFQIGLWWCKKQSWSIQLINEGELKNEDDLKCEDDLKYEDDLKCEEDLKCEDGLKYEDDLKYDDKNQSGTSDKEEWAILVIVYKWSRWKTTI